MNEKPSVIPFLLAALMVVVLLCGMLGSQALNDLTGQNAARVAEAQSREMQALAIVETARVDFEQAAGARAVLEAAAGAVESDTQLVEYYARRGDTRAALMVIVGLLLFWLRGQPAQNIQPPERFKNGNTL